jgi:hypothetical protein
VINLLCKKETTTKGDKVSVKALTSEDTFVAGGTSLKGYIKATRAQIEEAFGAPTYETPSADDKVTTEWVIVFPSENEDDKEIIATIYDWKRYEDGKPEMGELIFWNIGGHSIEATDKVAEAVGVASYGSGYPIWLN